jgi:molybdopterin synthase sulfur carrier subunit
MSEHDQPIKLLYFAWVREKVGRAEEHIVVPEGIQTIGELMAWLAARGPEYGAVFAKPGVVRAAIDRQHVKATAPLGRAREIAFFPPVTGG